MTQPLHTKYRPKRLADVIGQRIACNLIKTTIAKHGSHAFLFTGPAGSGKTSLARITAEMVGAATGSIMEIDGATHTGIDGMRAIQQSALFRPMGTSTARAIIVDEAHRISRPAWDSLLKVVEEPPAHLYWMFCTTEPSKVPTTIKTRCTHVGLKSLSDSDLMALLKYVCKQEESYPADEILRIVVKEAGGSPRQALVNLAAVADAKNRKEASEALRAVLESDPIIELCRLLVRGASWQKTQAAVLALAEENPESVRIVVMNYVASCLKSASEKDAQFFMAILDQFATPFNQSEGMAPLWLAVGRLLFN